MLRKLFKFYKRGRFGYHDEEQNDKNAENHKCYHRKCHWQDNKVNAMNFGVTCDKCSSNNEIKAMDHLYISKGEFMEVVEEEIQVDFNSKAVTGSYQSNK